MRLIYGCVCPYVFVDVLCGKVDGGREQQQTRLSNNNAMIGNYILYEARWMDIVCGEIECPIRRNGRSSIQKNGNLVCPNSR